MGLIRAPGWLELAEDQTCLSHTHIHTRQPTEIRLISSAVTCGPDQPAERVSKETESAVYLIIPWTPLPQLDWQLSLIVSTFMMSFQSRRLSDQITATQVQIECDVTQRLNKPVDFTQVNILMDKLIPWNSWCFCYKSEWTTFHVIQLWTCGLSE